VAPGQNDRATFLVYRYLSAECPDYTPPWVRAVIISPANLYPYIRSRSPTHVSVRNLFSLCYRLTTITEHTSSNVEFALINNVLIGFGHLGYD
jgi:hypothetical protein